MRASRLLSLLILLQLRGRVSASVLAAELEVSIRTIYRDIDALSAAGVPIYADVGRNGGISLHEGYRTRLTGLTAAEAEALPLAGLAGAARDLGLGPAAAAAQLKLLASLPAASSASAQRIAARFHVDPVAWYDRAEVLPHLPALASAVWREKKIRIAYESWEAAVTRRLDPLGLVQKGGLWYLVAASGSKPRTYRVASIKSLDVLEAGAVRPPRFNLARYWAASIAAFEARLLRERATLRISEEGRRILRAVHPAAAEMVDATQRPAAQTGWVLAEAPMEGPAYAARQLLRLGAEVVVLKPAALRAAIAAEAARVRALYVKA